VDPPGEKKKRKRSKKKGAGAAVPESRPALVKSAPSVEIWEVVPVVEEWQEVGTKKAKGKTEVVAPVTTTTTVPSSSIPPGGDAAAGVGVEESPLAPLEVEETSVTLPTGDDPLIFIGKGGATIQKLQESTGAKFHLNRGTNMLTISGLEDAVQLGLAAALSILAAEAKKKASEVEESVTWGSDAIKAVIGRGGANIRAAQEATGTRIDADVDSGTLVIVGSADQVAIALTMCKNAAFGEVNEVIELSSRNAVNLIFGQNFQTIRSLQDSTGCKLDIARGSTTLKLSGSSDAVAKAKANIHALLDTNRGFEMTIEVSKVGAVYGKGGETLRSIENKTGTQIDVVRGPTHATISVMGTAEASGRARNMLQRAIDGDVELKPGEVAEEIALGLATAAVIGRGGSNVAIIEKKHGVKVNVRSELQKARVVGKPNNVAEAVKEIDAIVKPIMKRAEDQKKVDDAVKAGDSEWQIKSEQADDAEGW
jgi:polyribonucleotide nucleotidyltransferase